MDRQAFFTKDRANAGIRLPLFDPETGKKTEHWLMVLGRDSDAYVKQEMENERRLMEIARENAGADEKTRAKAFAAQFIEEEPMRRRLKTASLVAGWSFPEECTREAVIETLEQSPQIERELRAMEEDQTLFFGRAVTNSTDTPRPSSDSTSPSESSAGPAQEEPKPSANV